MFWTFPQRADALGSLSETDVVGCGLREVSRVLHEHARRMETGSRRGYSRERKVFFGTIVGLTGNHLGAVQNFQLVIVPRLRWG